MKHIRNTKASQVFHLLPQEKRLFVELLDLYPLIPESHYSLSKTGDPEAMVEKEKLLREAMAEQHQQHKEQLQSLLRNPDWLTRCSNGYRLTLSGSQPEFLLQVLNDIRIGSWLKLGAPSECERGKIVATEHNARHLMAMDLCAFFQMALMENSG